MLPDMLTAVLVAAREPIVKFASASGGGNWCETNTLAFPSLFYRALTGIFFAIN